MKKHLVGIYKITNPKGAIYIGQSYHINRRWAQYRSLRNCKNQPKLFNSLKKYGSQNHKFEILCVCTREELNEREKYYIDLYQSFNSKMGLNLKIGGQNCRFSEETIIKMKNSHRGVKLSEYHRKRQGDGHRGDKHYLYGKHRSEKTKEKLRLARLLQPCPRKGKKHSSETKLKISIAKKGRKLNQEWKNKISAGTKGRIVKQSTRNKISEGMKKIWRERVRPAEHSSAFDTHEKVSAINKGFGHIKLQEAFA